MIRDTIFAPATGLGPAGIAVIRISGPGARAALMARTSISRLPEPRRAVRASLKDGAGEVIDEGLVLWFAEPASFTGEDVAELHVHGGRAVVADILASLAGCEGLRPAEPGEFSRRAFENEKLDLTAAEGLADLVDAETAAQRRQALRQLQGELGRLYDGWRERLIRALAHLEATIDFSDEELPPGVESAVRDEIQRLDSEVSAHLADGRRGERLRDGIRIAIVGPPNAGKSTLLNALARREAAIVADSPGTTRDVIEVHLDLGGYPVTIADTAGLRNAEEPVEKEGVRRSRAAAAAADLRLVVLDGATWPAVAEEAAAMVDDNAIPVISKSDCGRVDGPQRLGGQSILTISARTGAGMDALEAAVAAAVKQRFAAGSTPSLTRVRHRQALEDCRCALSRSLEAREAEMFAEDLRLAARALGRITGRVDVEDLLDVVFRDFCIGK